MKPFVMALIAITGPFIYSSGQSQSTLPPVLPREHETLIPFHLKAGGFMMIDGSVNGVRGEFMFDTGSPFSFFLNDHRLGLGPGKVLSHGSAASGQGITVMLHQGETTITVANDIKIEGIEEVRISDFGFVEKEVKADFLGFMGRDLVRGGPVLVDYDTSKLVVPKSGADLSIYGKGVVLHFAPNAAVPSLAFHIKDVSITGSFDTGSLGEFVLTKEARHQLLQSGALREEMPGAANTTYNLSGLTYEGSMITLHGLSLETGNTNRVSGYMFLKNFRALWNLDEGTISLLEREVPPDAHFVARP
jgi:hypothetical protein